MISRIWKATASQQGAATYAEHFRARVIPSLARLDGYQGAMLMQRRSGERVEMLVISFWSSEDAIRAFAGSDLQRAVVADEARRVLESVDETVSHFTLIAHDGTGFS